jgi:hypothetical protein
METWFHSFLLLMSLLDWVLLIRTASVTCLNIASSPNTPVTFTLLACSVTNVTGVRWRCNRVRWRVRWRCNVFGDDAMLRQVTEAVLISRTQSSRLINNKNEWNHVSIPRAVVNYEWEVLQAVYTKYWHLNIHRCNMKF